MFYGQFIDELIARLKLNKDTPGVRAIAGRKINEAYKEVGNVTQVNWPELKRYGEIVTTPNYVTGTATITNGSRTVTGSGTTWTLAMEGRFFRPQGSANWYKIIKFVSATEITLFSAIIESSASAQTYAIWKRFYYLPSEVGKILEFGSWIRDGILTEKSQNDLHQNNSNLSLTGEPKEFSPYGVDPFERTYTDGTVTIPNDSALLTGVSTLWLDNVEPGDIVTLGVNTYRVRRVESDTTIRLLNRSITEVTGASAYTITKDMNLGFQLWFNPGGSYLLPYSYRKRVYDMVNEAKDMMELPEKFNKAILDGAEADRLSDLDDAKWTSKQALYAARVKDLKTNQFLSTPQSRQMRPEVSRNRGRYL